MLLSNPPPGNPTSLPHQPFMLRSVVAISVSFTMVLVFQKEMLVGAVGCEGYGSNSETWECATVSVESTELALIPPCLAAHQLAISKSRC